MGHVPYCPGGVFCAPDTLAPAESGSRIAAMTFDHVFDALDVTLEPFALCEIRGAASLGPGRRSDAVLHYVVTGEGAIDVEGHAPIPARPGTVVLVPAYAPHSLHGSGSGRGRLPDCRPLDISIEHHRAGSGEGVMGAICGSVSVVYRGLSGTMDLLRAPIVEQLDDGDRIRDALEDLVAELTSPTLGTRAFARSLLLQCMILLFRRRLQARDPSLDWLRGLGDETLWEPLRAMLDEPGRGHTVDSLAAVSGMSRSIFAARFSEAFGTGPIDLLRTVRLRRAAELLTNSDLPVKRIASLVGYDSRTYFSRAFKVEHGLSPDQFRRGIGVPPAAA